MKPFSIWITEARKNPEQNPKISSYEALKQYEDDPDIYISMTDNLQLTPTGLTDYKNPQTKIGINPKTNYSTPAGIYAYPLKEAFKKYDIHRVKNLSNSLPLGGTRPFVNILKLNKSEKFVTDMYTTYTSKDYDKDYRIVREMFVDHCKTFKPDESIAQNLVNLREIGDARFSDEIEDKIDALEAKEEEGITDDVIKQAWIVFISIVLDTRKETNAVMAFWQMTRLLAILMIGKDGGTKMSFKWNSILRKCGYSGFADKTGKGYIHPAEPMQALFLSKDAFTVIDTIRNKNYNTQVIKTFGDLLSWLEKDPTAARAYWMLGVLLKGKKSQVKIVPEIDDLLNSASFSQLVQFFVHVNHYVNFNPEFGDFIQIDCTKLLEKYKKTHTLNQNALDVVNELIFRMYKPDKDGSF